jgi:hypothetical protein
MGICAYITKFKHPIIKLKVSLPSAIDPCQPLFTNRAVNIFFKIAVI